jgi:hypothetical protein
MERNTDTNIFEDHVVAQNTNYVLKDISMTYRGGRVKIYGMHKKMITITSDGMITENTSHRIEMFTKQNIHAMKELFDAINVKGNIFDMT